MDKIERVCLLMLVYFVLDLYYTFVYSIVCKLKMSFFINTIMSITVLVGTLVLLINALVL